MIFFFLVKLSKKLEVYVTRLYVYIHLSCPFLLPSALGIHQLVSDNMDGGERALGICTGSLEEDTVLKDSGSMNRPCLPYQASYLGLEQPVGLHEQLLQGNLLEALCQTALCTGGCSDRGNSPACQEKMYGFTWYTKRRTPRHGRVADHGWDQHSML